MSLPSLAKRRRFARSHDPLGLMRVACRAALHRTTVANAPQRNGRPLRQCPRHPPSVRFCRRYYGATIAAHVLGIPVVSDDKHRWVLLLNERKRLFARPAIRSTPQRSFAGVWSLALDMCWSQVLCGPHAKHGAALAVNVNDAHGSL